MERSLLCRSSQTTSNERVAASNSRLSAISRIIRPLPAWAASSLSVLVVPSDRLGVFLTDRGPRMTDAKRHVAEARAEDLPLILIAIDHDGPGPALQKQPKKKME